MVYCVNAEADNRKIQRDIMPTLLNNSHLQITKFGIAEKEEDSLSPLTSLEKGIEQVVVVDALLRSAKEGREIVL